MNAEGHSTLHDLGATTMNTIHTITHCDSDAKEAVRDYVKRILLNLGDSVNTDFEALWSDMSELHTYVCEHPEAIEDEETMRLYTDMKTKINFFFRMGRGDEGLRAMRERATQGSRDHADNAGCGPGAGHPPGVR